MANDDAKKAYASVEQKNLLLQFVKKHPQIISGKFSPDFTQKDAQILWQKISDILNSCVGAKKDWKSWRKAWQDIRSRTKSKRSDFKKNYLATGGGPHIKNPLTHFDDEVLDTITVVALEGHTSVKESRTDFTFGDTSKCDDEVTPLIPIPTLSTSTTMNLRTSPEVQDLDEKAVSKSSVPKKKPFPRAPRKKLLYSSQAAQDYKVSLENKNSIKSEYYKKKIAILERMASAKEKSAEAKADIAQNIAILANAAQALYDAIG